MYFCALENEYRIIKFLIMTKLSNWKTLLVVVLFVACLELPASAQKSDAFFYNDDSYNNRSENLGNYNIGTQIFGSDVFGGYNITTQVFGQETPLDGGLAVLAITGVAYAIKKRKSNNKK